MSTTRRRWVCGTPLNRSIWARISSVDLPWRSSSPGRGSASDMCPGGFHTPTENAKGGPKAARRQRSRADLLGADLEREDERDDERVDDQRLDQREAEDHRGADLAGGAGVARDAVQRGGRGAALADATAERGDADAQAGGERDQA